MARGSGLTGTTGAAATTAGATSTTADLVVVPPGPLATRLYVVVCAGVRTIDPLGCTAPTPSIWTSVALSVDQVRVTCWPCWILPCEETRTIEGAGVTTAGAAWVSGFFSAVCACGGAWF